LTAEQVKNVYNGGAISFGLSDSNLVPQVVCGDGAIEGDEECECGINVTGSIGELYCSDGPESCSDCLLYMD